VTEKGANGLTGQLEVKKASTRDAMLTTNRERKGREERGDLIHSQTPSDVPREKKTLGSIHGAVV